MVQFVPLKLVQSVDLFTTYVAKWLELGLHVDERGFFFKKKKKKKARVTYLLTYRPSSSMVVCCANGRY
jgi:hypothetical protein